MRILYPHLFNASILQSNVIEAGADMKRDTEKEWYYGNKDKERLGTSTFY
jgi:DnaJ family protein C protein 13